MSDKGGGVERGSALRFNLGELSGALGDLGTFVPLAASLIVVCGMDGGSILVFAGLANLLVGVIFKQPLPVQPMKAIAAVAIAEGLAPGEIAAAGFLTGAIVLALALTGLVSVAERWIPRPVVRGIQLGVGLKLAAKGVGMALGVDWWALDGQLLALGATLLVLATSRLQRFPSALLLFVAGLVVLGFEQPGALGEVSLGWAGPAWLWPSAEQWQVGLARGALPQLPLTLLNSVIAVCALSEDLFPGRGIRTRPMALSVGLMNLSTCLLGAMPACHGSGGLAGQYRFGARSGGSVVALGLGKIALGLLFGAAAGPVLAAFPVSLLGVLLAFAGLELTLPAREAHGRDAFFVAAATAGGILAVNTAVGFLLGLVAALFLLGRPSSQRS
jgi:MFS superfamily sulfate permease-like transporter